MLVKKQMSRSIILTNHFGKLKIVKWIWRKLIAIYRLPNISSMRKLLLTALCTCTIVNSILLNVLYAQTGKYDSAAIAKLKQQVLPLVAAKEKQVQEMVDMVFSFGELGFQEFETSKYLTDILTKNGFTVEKGIAGIPTAWMAKWGSGSPVIALGSDLDCIPKASQKPGVAYKDPIVEGAPGHGEGHNSGQAVIIFAAITMKEMMEKNKIPGTLMIWPGVAEELLGSKAWYIRDGYFKNVDACILRMWGMILTAIMETSDRMDWYL